MFSTTLVAQCSTWYKDTDNDGFGDLGNTQVSCTTVAGYVLNHLDCNDNFLNTPIRKSIGGGGFSNGATNTTKIDLGPDGNPVVLYQNFTTSGAINSIGVKRFDGTTWVTLGSDPISTTYDMSYADLILDASGTPYISFTDFDVSGSAQNKVTVLKYNSATNTWNLVGARRFSPTVAPDRRIDIQLDATGTPYVAFLDDSFNAVVMKFNSATSAWELVGVPGFSSVSSELTLDFDNTNVPYVAFSDGSDGRITVMKFDTASASWIYVGSPSFSDFDIDNPKIDLSSTGVPYVAYYDYGADEVVVQKFTGSAWVKVGSTSVHSGAASWVSLAIDQLDGVYVAYEDDAATPSPEVILKKLDASDNWVNTTATVDNGLNVSLAIGPDNIPYVSFSNLAQSDKATAQQIAPQPVSPTLPTLATTASTICTGASATLSITAGNLNDGKQWVWYAGGCGTGTSLGTGTTLIASPTVTTTYYARGEGSCGVGSCKSITITVNQYPTVPTLSASLSTICAGASTTLSITAGSLNSATQWVWYAGGCGLGTAVGTGTSISVAPTVTTKYFARGEGLCSGSCSNIMIIVNDPAAITAQPTATQTLCTGTALNLSVTATGTGLTYQWKKNGTNIGSATSNTYSIASVATGDAATYTVDVTSSGVCATPTVTSNNAVVIINTPSTITAQPTATQTLCTGTALNLSVTATGTGLTYQWKKNGTNIGSATSNTYSIASVATGDAATYTVDVTSSGACTTPTVTSNNAVVIINTPSTITAQPTASQTLCTGAPLNLSVTATGTGLTYQWKKNGTTIGSATSNTYSIASVAAGDAATYTVDITSSGVCTTPTVTSNNAVVIINTPATITAQPTATQTLCTGTALNLSVTATGTGLTYQWKKNGTNIGSATSNTYSIASVAAGDAATYTVDITSSGVCTTPTVTSNNAVVIINTPATITAQPTTTQTLCTGTALNLSVTATGTGLTYQWKKNGTNIGSATSNTYSIASVAAGDAATYTVDITSSGVCTTPTVTSNNAVVTINTPSTITAQPTSTQTLCTGTALNLSVTATGTGLTYQWKKNGTNIGSATSNTYSIASVAAGDAATYTVDVTSSGVCTTPTVTSNNAVVIINTPSTITAQPTATQTLCTGTALNLSVTATGTGLTYQWKKNGTNIGSATGNTYSIASVATGDAATYTVDVTSSGACTTPTVTSNNAVVIINTPAVITAQPTATQTLCTGAPLNLSVTATGTGISYQWKKDGTNIISATGSSYNITNVTTGDAATYTVDVTSNAVCGAATVTSNNAVVTINTPATITAQPTASQTLCTGTALNLSVTATGTGLTYQWKKNGTNIGSATSNTYSIASVAAGDAATYTVDVTSSGVCATPTVTSNNAVVIINTPSTITAQPTATQTLCTGTALNLSVTATGTGLTYQWKKNGTNIGSATSNTYSIASVATGDAATYTVDVISNAVCGAATVTSNNAVVIINTPSTITAHPTATQTLCTGTALNLSVTATGTGLTYQWKKNGTTIGSATSNTYSIASVTTGDAATYTVDVISNAVCGAATVTSNNAVVIINTPATITAQPTATQTLCTGTALNLSVTATGTGLTYQWKKNGTTIGSATSNTYSIASVATGDAATYTVDVISNAVCGAATVTSNNAVVIINTPSTITAQPTASQTLCTGTTLNLSVTATGTGISYQWKKDGTNIISATGSSYSITNVTTGDAATYTVDVISNAVCSSATVTSNNAVVTINTPSTITAQPTASQTLCTGSALNLSVTATGTGLNYQWKKDGSIISGATSNSYSIASVGTGDAATYTVDITSSGVCVPATVTSSNAVVTINAPSIITVQPTANQTLCVGAALNLSVTATGTGITYQWKKNGANIGSATGNTYTIVAVATSDAATYTVDVMSSSSVCPSAVVTSNDAVVAINAPSSITTQPTVSQILCTGASLNLSVTATGTALTYQWKKDGTTIASATGSNFSITNVIPADAATYTVEVTNGGVCPSATVTSNNAVVTINAPSTITVQPTASQTICSGTALNLSVTATGTGLTYQWKKNGTTIGSATSNTYSIASVATGDAAIYTVDVTSSGVCTTPTVTSNNAVVIINTPSTITAQPTATQTLCTGTALNLSVTATGTGISYQWKKDGTNIISATGSSYNITNVTTGDAATYTVDVISNAVCSSTTVTSNNAVVIINTSSAITVQPTATQTLCVGAPLNLSVTATGTGISYQWKKDGTNIISATGSSYSITNVTTGDAATYTVDVISNAVCGAATVTSNNAVVIINTPSTITAHPTATQTLCTGTALNLSVTATGTGISYQWKKDGTNIVSATGSSYSITNVTTGDAATYTVDVISNAVCSSTTVTSNNAVVIINTSSAITVQPTASQTLCVGAPLNLSVTATGTGVSYQWKKDGTNIISATGSSYSITNVTTGDAATYTVDVISNAVCSSTTVTSNNAVVTINAPAVISVQPTATQTLCVGAPLNLSVTATGTGVSYQWKKDGTNIISATGSSYSITNVTTGDAATYTVDVTSNAVCSSTTVASNNAVVTINAPAVISVQPTATQTLCVGAPLNLSVTATGTGVSYQWKKNGTNIISATGSSYSITNVTTGDAATYTVNVISNAVCSSTVITSNNAVVAINAPPVITAQPGNATLCAGGTANFSVTATGTNVGYQWQEDDGNGFADIANGGSYSGAALAQLTITNASAAQSGHKFKVIVSNAACSPASSNGLATVVVNTVQSIITQPNDTITCTGSLARFSVSANNPALSYQWQVDDGNGYTDISNGSLYTGAFSKVLLITATTQAMNNYKFRVSVTGACVDEKSNPATLTVNALPEVSAGPDKTVELGSAVILEGSVSGDGPFQYLWLEIASGESTKLQPTVSPVTDMNYTLQGTSAKGCSATDQVMVTVLKQFVIPNAFSPNNDGINDTWKIENLDQFPKVSIQVFNRYGEPVFSSSSTVVSWNGTYNGKQLPWGTYYYIIDLQNGNKPLSGWVVIFN